METVAIDDWSFPPGTRLAEGDCGALHGLYMQVHIDGQIRRHAVRLEGFADDPDGAILAGKAALLNWLVAFLEDKYEQGHV